MVYVNGVYQKPTTNYTVSGTILTFTGALVSSDEIDVHHLSIRTGVTHVADGSVTSTKIADDAVGAAAIADDAITGGKLANDIAISTTGNIATTGSGTLTSAGAFTASGGIANAGTITAGTLGSSVVFPAGHVIKVGRKQIVPVDYASGGHNFNRDNTIPLITEGSQVIQYDFTPKDTSGSSKLLIQANFWMGERGNVTNKFTGALFINNTCVHVQSHGAKEGADWTTFFIQHYASHSGSAVDIEIRSDSGTNISVNPQSQTAAADTYYTAGSSSFGGSVSNSELIVWEITA